MSYLAYHNVCCNLKSNLPWSRTCANIWSSDILYLWFEVEAEVIFLKCTPCNF